MDYALAMIDADLRYRAGDESGAEALYDLITELVARPDRDELYDTICALIQLASPTVPRSAQPLENPDLREMTPYPGTMRRVVRVKVR